VVTTSGVTDRSWLDVRGHPHTEALIMTERFHRVDVGQMDIEVTYTDPGTFKTLCRGAIRAVPRWEATVVA
jgi:hypothetical protein